MRAKRFFSLVIGFCLSLIAIFYFQNGSVSLSQKPESIRTETNSQGQTVDLSAHPLASNSNNAPSTSTSQANPAQSKRKSSSIHELTENNLEEVIGRCFQGEPCELKEDPWQLYLKFKSAGRATATDSLISYLRKELQNPKYRDQYKDVLLKMIDDFYPSNNLKTSTNNLDFQHAAYYYYLGDFNTSLDIYLKMEKTAESDPNAFHPFNIANDLYELHRWKEALVYYRKALDELISQNHGGPDQQAVIHFLQDRISKLERK
jgi:tetratricopeptide (TPR) repeat protein